MPNTLKISPSQIVTASSCVRKWFFTSVLRLPQPFDKKKLLGEVGHGVCENYALNKELYPINWEYPTNRFTGEKGPICITRSEQILVKALISSAIESGALHREPDGQVEMQIGPPLGVIDTIGDTQITLSGFIDYFYGNVIEDHKFTGAPQYYGVSSLSKAIPMNLYAWACYKNGMIKDPTCWLRYNLFVKSYKKPAVVMKHTEKTKKSILDFFDKDIAPNFKPMVTYANPSIPWKDIPCAMSAGNDSKACGDYGGCEFRDLCFGATTIEEYTKRSAVMTLEDREQSQSDVLEKMQLQGTTIKPKENIMANSGFLAGLMQNKPAAPTQSAPPIPTPTCEPTPVPQSEPPDQKPSAPWAYAECTVCKRSKSPVNGINEKGEPCQICVLSTNSLHESDPTQPIVDDYNINIGSDGTVSWSLKNSVQATPPISVPIVPPPVVREHVVGVGGDTFEPEVVSNVNEREPEPMTDAPVRTEDSPDAFDIDDPAPVASDTAPKGIPQAAFDPSRDTYNPERTGTKGFTLAYGPVRSKLRASKKLGESNCIVHIGELADMVSGKLLILANRQGAGASSFEDVPYFTRRDLIFRNAHAIAELVGNSVVEASCMVDASTEHNICSAIERYASLVIGAM